MIKTLHCQCIGCEFDAWLGNWDPHATQHGQNIKEKIDMPFGQKSYC